MSKKLDAIEEKFGKGSAVGILGFNRFNRFDNDEEVIDTIKRVVATHFTPVIYSGAMEVVVYVNGEEKARIDEQSLRGIIKLIKDKTKAIKGGIGPAGIYVWQAYQSLEETHLHDIDTSLGKVRLHFRELDMKSDNPGGSRIQLYRNGMWITDDIPHNQLSNFGEVVPFNALILFEPEQNEEVCELIRRVEGPKHIRLGPARLGSDHEAKRDFRALFKEIKEALLKIAPKVPQEEFNPDFIVLSAVAGAFKKTGGSNSGTGSLGRASRQRGKSGKERNDSTDHSKNFKRSGSDLKASRLIIAKTRGYQVIVRPGEKAKNVELRLILSNGTDESCDTPLPDSFLEIQKASTLNGEPIPQENYILQENGNDRVLAVHLGAIESLEKELDIWIPCTRLGGASVDVQLIKRGAIPRNGK